MFELRPTASKQTTETNLTVIDSLSERAEKTTTQLTYLESLNPADFANKSRPEIAKLIQNSGSNIPVDRLSKFLDCFAEVVTAKQQYQSAKSPFEQKQVVESIVKTELQKGGYDTSKINLSQYPQVEFTSFGTIITLGNKDFNLVFENQEQKSAGWVPNKSDHVILIRANSSKSEASDTRKHELTHRERLVFVGNTDRKPIDSYLPVDHPDDIGAHILAAQKLVHNHSAIIQDESIAHGTQNRDRDVPQSYFNWGALLDQVETMVDATNLSEELKLAIIQVYEEAHQQTLMEGAKFPAESRLIFDEARLRKIPDAKVKAYLFETKTEDTDLVCKTLFGENLTQIRNNWVSRIRRSFGKLIA